MYKVVVDYAPTEADNAVVREGITAFNESILGERDKAFSIFLKNDSGKVFGGIQAFLGTESIYIDVLWVEGTLQKQGYGTKLLEAAEREAIQNGCIFSLVDTWDFQAEAFYVKNGYERIGEIKNYWLGHAKILLRKTLRPSSKCHIRPLQERDIPLLGDLYFPWSPREATITKWTGYLDEQKKGARMACIAEQHGKIVGYGNLLPSSEYPHFKQNKIPEINEVWVYEEHRKKGIATALIAHLEQLAKQQGYTTIGIGVGLYRDYGAAQRLYFRLGYKPDGEGVTYKHTMVTPGEKYAVDDDLILWLTKNLA